MNYFGRPDIVRFLSNVCPTRIPWSRYQINWFSDGKSMSWTMEYLRCIYVRTQGRCHIGGKTLAFVNYGRHASKGAWNIERSIPRARGGSDHGNIIFTACILCNSSKGTRSTKSARGTHGRTRAPMSEKSENGARHSNAIAGGGLGAIIGGIVAGPVGLVGGSIFGAILGHDYNPES